MSKRIQITLSDDVYTKLSLISEAYYNLSKSAVINMSIDSFYVFCETKGLIPYDAFYKATSDKK